MRLGSLSDELDAITKDFDYGIVPGSATIFVKDEANDIGRVDLTLLEGVMIVLEVTNEGYRVLSYSPLALTESALSTVKLIQSQFQTTYDTMENLLMTISPMFKAQFEENLYTRLKNMQSIMNKEREEQEERETFFIDHNHWY